MTATTTYKRGITPVTATSTATISFGVTAAPVVSAPIEAGATSVSGTSGETDGTVVEVFVDRGSGFASEGSTAVAGGSWTRSGLVALLGGHQVKARATAPAKVTSAVSNVVTVTGAGTTAQPTVAAPLVEGATAISGTTPDGGTVEVFVDGVSRGFAVVNGTTRARGGTPTGSGLLLLAGLGAAWLARRRRSRVRRV